MFPTAKGPQRTAGRNQVEKSLLKSGAHGERESDKSKEKKPNCREQGNLGKLHQSKSFYRGGNNRAKMVAGGLREDYRVRRSGLQGGFHPCRENITSQIKGQYGA